jgi:hypothetical protein
MPINDRDYIRGRHPPNCSCAECTNKRLTQMRGGTHENHIYTWPKSGGSTLGKRFDNAGGQKTYRHRPHIPNWLKPILLIGALSIGGLIASRFVGSLIPFWLLFGFSVFYSIEKWLGYYTRKHKNLGRIYRLILNLSLLSLLGLLIWSGVSLFTQQFLQSPLVGSLVFLLELAVFIWFCRVVSRNGWRQPSMKLTVFSLVCLFFIFSFAGVQPLSDYKDTMFDSISTYFRNANQPDTTPSPPDTTPPPSDEINSYTGKYENYCLGLVKTPEVLSGSDCYGEFIVLINNEDARNPTYSELLGFLRSDETDAFPYQYTLPIVEFYYPPPEDEIDLDQLKDIIDGTAEPNSPKICADFAERLHNNAEMAGIRCAYVSLTLAGNTGHACNAFQTTDRGLIYIDCTGISAGDGPERNDRTVDIKVGKQYDPEYLFPSGGWYIPSGAMGTVTSIFITWDGDWR